MKNDDLFLETAIPKSYYKFIREIDGEEEYNRFLAEERNSYQETSAIGQLLLPSGFYIATGRNE